MIIINLKKESLKKMLAKQLKKFNKLCRSFSNYTTTLSGTGFEKRIYLQNNNKTISYWNDLPLKANSEKKTFNIAIEIPNKNLAKMELCKEEENHPIKQDTRKNRYNKTQTELRYYAQFPLFNYGFLPQTWENPNLQTDIEGLFVIFSL